jgi:hypothetical protein
LLRALQAMKPAAFEAALAGMRATAPPALAPAVSPVPVPARASATASPEATDDPRQFLLRVMNDESVALALRIEAAKALL